MSLVETIKTLVEEELKDSSLFLVDIVNGERSKKIRVLIDGDTAVTVDQCSKLSRSISKVVDEETFESEPFILEVSSPGADEPLKKIRQYGKHVGRTLEVETNEGVSKIKLLHLTEDAIVGEPVLDKKEKKKNKSVEPINIAFNNIITSTVVLSFK